MLFHVLPDVEGSQKLTAAQAPTEAAVALLLQPAPSIDTDTTDQEWMTDDTASDSHLTPNHLDAYAASTAVAVAEGLINIEPGPIGTEGIAAVGETTAGEKRTIANIDFAALPPEGQKRFRVSLNQQRLFSLGFSSMFAVALLLQEPDQIHTGGGDLSRRQVSFQWKNPDFLSRNPDFLLKNFNS